MHLALRGDLIPHFAADFAFCKLRHKAEKIKIANKYRVLFTEKHTRRKRIDS
jgi:hypothetical protein